MVSFIPVNSTDTSRRAFIPLKKMAELLVSPVFKEISFVVGGQMFSAMYYGRHCDREVLIVQHDVTLMLVFKDNSLTPEFTKSVSSNGVPIKGTQIVGNENIVLLLDDNGKLWRLVNAFEFTDRKDTSLFLLDEKCFYEWVPFKKFALEKVLTVSAWRCGFACIGIQRNSERKLLFLSTVESDIVQDYTFEEVRSSNSPNFYLSNLFPSAEDLVRCRGNLKDSEEKLVMSDRLTGKTYLCSGDRENTLINYSNNILVSGVHFKPENCLLLCFQNGKLVFHFLDTIAIDCVLFLPKSVSLVEKCCCFGSCLLWSDGVCLHHTKLVFQSSEPYVKLIHLKLDCNLQKPSHLVRFQQGILAVTINNIYYHIRAGSDAGEVIERQPDELLSEISKGSLKVHKLNTEIDMITYFLHCKEMVDKNDMKEKVEMSLEQNCLVIKFLMGIILRKEFWKVRLMTCIDGKYLVKMVGFATDVSEGMVVRIDNLWRYRNKVKVSLVGDFAEESLFMFLGEIGESGKAVDNLSEHLKEISLRRNPFCLKSK